MKNTTLRNVVPLLLITLLSVVVKAQTNVSGFISANTTWDVAGSPYIVISNALISQGVTLTINPGVVVKFDSACTLQVDGEMIAIGTASNRITFTSNKAIPKPGDWSELHFSDYAVDATFDNSGNYLSGCIMKYCDVLYGGTLNNQYGEIHIESSSPYFSRCNINYSSRAGLYCNGSSCLVDSSAIDSCAYGLDFSNVYLNSCGVTVLSDTIKNCSRGIAIDNINGICRSIIKNNYFISNGPGEILVAYITNGEITDNHFVNNSASSVSLGLVFISGDSLLISDNSFINNGNTDEGSNSSSLISVSGNTVMISDNSFINNFLTSSDLDEGGGIIVVREGRDTIECNLFLNNQISHSEMSAGCIYAGNIYNLNLVISHNVFDGNVNSDSLDFGASVVWISGDPSIPVTFTNNTIRNNYAPLNACCVFNPILNTNNPLLYIEQNNFINNVSKDIIYLSGGNTSNATYNFLYMKNNNFNDPAAQYELYNNIPYGSPDLYPDSNYWGSTSTQHIDSVIFDYFDNEALSVVYYQPILTVPVAIDTTCTGGFSTGIKNVDDATNSKAFPNPFSNSTEVMFGKELQDAEVAIYNVFGQKMRSIEHFSGNELIIDRGNLSNGIYIYTVVEKQTTVANGKLVVE